MSDDAVKPPGSGPGTALFSRESVNSASSGEVNSPSRRNGSRRRASAHLAAVALGYPETSLLFIRKSNPVRQLCILVSHSKLFENFILVCILCNCITLGMSSNRYGFENTLLGDTLKKFEYLWVAIFTAEALLKIVSMGFWMAPGTYLRDGWNVIDFAVVALGYVDFFTSGNMTAVRTVRVLRPLRAITRIQGMKVLVTTMIASMPLLLDVIFLCAFTFFVWGLVAVQLFAGALKYRCGEPDFNSSFTAALGDGKLVIDNVSYIVLDSAASDVCSGPLAADTSWYEVPPSNSPVAQPGPRGGGYVCPADTFCTAYGNPNYGMTSFDNILWAWLTIFQCITLESWTDVMYYTSDAVSWWVWPFFVALVVFGAFFLVSLALAVLFLQFSAENHDSHDQERRKLQQQHEHERARQEKQRLERQRQRRASVGSGGSGGGVMSDGEDADVFSERSLSLTSSGRPSMLDVTGVKPLGREASLRSMKSSNMLGEEEVVALSPARRALYRVAVSRGLGTTTIVLILINTAVMCVNWYGLPARVEAATNYINYGLTGYFVVELLIRLGAFGFRRYFSDGMNLFDFLVVVVSVAEIIVSLIPSVAGVGPLSVMRMLRLLRVFRLARNWRELYIILHAILRSVMSTTYLMLLMLLFMFIAALMGMQLFGYKFMFCDYIAGASAVCPPGQAVWGECPNHFYCYLPCTSDQYGSWVDAPGSFYNDLAYCDRFCATAGAEPAAAATNASSSAAVADAVGGCEYLAMVGKSQVPRAQFDNVFWAMFTVFQLLTGENWNNVMYDSMRTTSPYSALYYVFVLLIGTYLVFNLFIAILLDNFTGAVELIGADYNNDDQTASKGLGPREEDRSFLEARTELPPEPDPGDGGATRTAWRLAAGKQQLRRQGSDASASGYGSDAGALDSGWPKAFGRAAQAPGSTQPGTSAAQALQEQPGAAGAGCVAGWDRPRGEEPGATGSGAGAGAQPPRMSLLRLPGEPGGEVGGVAAIITATSPRAWAGERRGPGTGVGPGPGGLQQPAGPVPPDSPRDCAAPAAAKGGPGRRRVVPVGADGWPSSALPPGSRPARAAQAPPPASTNQQALGSGAAISVVRAVDCFGVARCSSLGDPARAAAEATSQINAPTPPPCGAVAATTGTGHGTGPPAGGCEAGTSASGPGTAFPPAVSTRNLQPALSRSSSSSASASASTASSFSDSTAALPPRGLLGGLLGVLRHSYARAVSSLHAVPRHDDLSSLLTGRSLLLFGPDHWLRWRCLALVHNSHFESAMLLFIAASSVALALDAPSLDPASRLVAALRVMDYIFTAVFTVEAALKIVTFGFAFTGPHAYLRSGWNVLDAAVVAVGWALLVVQEVGLDEANLQMLRVLRTLRALRPLRAASRYEGLRVVVNALFAVLPAMANVALVCLLFYVVFAILAVNLFKGKLYKCTDAASGERIDPFYVLPEGQVLTRTWCEAGSQNITQSAYFSGTNVTIPEYTISTRWVNLRANFDNVGVAILTLFSVATLELWLDIAFSAVDATDVGQQPLRNHNPAVLLYFVVFVVVCSFFILNVFVGVTLEKVAELQREQTASRVFVTPQQQAWVEVQKLLLRTAMLPRPSRPEEPRWRRTLFDVVTSPAFGHAILGAILANTVFMALVHADMSDAWQAVMSYSNLMFSVIFVTEAALKITAFGPPGYFRDGWNCFDFFVAFVCGVSVVLDFSNTRNLSFMPVMRVLRVVRVIRLIRRAPGVQRLLMTLVYSLPALVNVGGIMLLFFSVYGIIGMNLFGDMVYGDFLNRHANFENFPNAMLVLMRIITGESWDGIMMDCMVTHDCVRVTTTTNITFPSSPASSSSYIILAAGTYLDPHDPLLSSLPASAVNNQCALSPAVAVLYFPTFVILCGFILLNLIIAVILENMMVEEADEALPVSRTMVGRFVDAWGAVDPAASGAIHASKLPLVIGELEPPLGTRGLPSRSAVQAVIMSVDIPVRTNNKVTFLETLHALAGRLAGAELPEIEEERIISRYIKRLPGGGSAFPKYTAAHFHAALHVKAAVRGFLARHQLLEKERELSVAITSPLAGEAGVAGQQQQQRCSPSSPQREDGDARERAASGAWAGEAVAQHQEQQPVENSAPPSVPPVAGAPRSAPTVGTGSE